MSADSLMTLFTALGLLLAIAGGFGWMIHRMDAIEARLSARIDGTDAKAVSAEHRLGDRIDAVESRLESRIDAVDAGLSRQIERLQRETDELRQDVHEVKVSVARLEGPSGPQLILAR